MPSQPGWLCHYHYQYQSEFESDRQSEKGPETAYLIIHNDDKPDTQNTPHTKVIK